MNARIVRAWATAIKPELNLIRKKCLKIISLVISLHSVSGYFPHVRAKHNVEHKKATATTNTAGLYDAQLLFWT